MNVFDEKLVRGAVVTKEHIDNIIATGNYKEFSYEECGRLAGYHTSGTGRIFQGRHMTKA